MLRLRKSVQFLGLRPEMTVALMATDGYFREAGVDWYIISASDGPHSPNSPHYAGCAVDIDVLEAEEDDLFGYAADLSDILSRDFNVVAEVSYIHIEYAPNKGPNL